jgi:3',5'-cyclic AMP phosphodiesterase CpdA
MRSGIALLTLVTLAGPQSAAPVPLPNHSGSYRFAVLGESGTGDRGQSELASQMAALRERFTFDDVLLLGDNVIGRERPQDFWQKFEIPYKPLLDAGVRFHAVLGNEDSREQRHFKNFNMGGKEYYTFQPRRDVQFIALESTYPERKQVEWLEAELAASRSPWKIVYLHHPPYSSGRRHGSDERLRGMLEPLFIKHNVSVVLSAHDNIYERTVPQSGITYFVAGSGGKVRRGDLDRNSKLTAVGFDTDLAFLAAEIVGDQMYFNAISRTGAVVDSGVLRRRQ